MTATVVGPGGTVEIANEEGDPIDVTIVGAVSIDATGLATEVTLEAVRAALDGLEGFTDGLEALTALLGLEATQQLVLAKLEQIRTGTAVTGAVDVTDRVGRLLGHTIVDASALPLNAATQSTLLLVLAKLVDIFGAVDDLELTADNIAINADSIDLNTNEVEAILRQIRDNDVGIFATEATVTVIAGLLAGTITIGGVVSVSNFPVTQAVSAVNFDIRDLDNLTDAVRSVDAAEDATLIAVPFTVTAAGTSVLIAAPGGGSLLRLRRLSPTYAIRSPVSEPVLALFVGAVEAQRGNALTGRFDITAAADTDPITLDIDILDVGGIVAGTVYYELA